MIWVFFFYNSIIWFKWGLTRRKLMRGGIILFPQARAGKYVRVSLSKIKKTRIHTEHNIAGVIVTI